MDVPLNAVDTFRPKMSLFATSSWRSATLLSTYTIAARRQRGREEGRGKAARTDVAAVDDGQMVRHLRLPRHVDVLDPDAPRALADAVRPEARPGLDISPRARS
jgi:hypothetical protein